MDRLELATQRAEEAQRLIDSPMFKAAFEDTRAAILEAWASLDDTTSERSTERAYDLHRMVKCLARVQRCLEIHIDTGKLAHKEIQGRSRLQQVFQR